MNVGIVSIRYARALFKFSVEKKVEDTVFSEMKVLADNLLKLRKLSKALESPLLTIKDKMELIKSAAGGTVSDTLVRFIDLVLHQNRENYLYAISLEFLDMYRDYKNISIGRLITASPISKEAEDKLKRLVLQHKPGTLELISEVDPAIVGGFRLYIDTYRLDASVTAQLKQIREQLLRKNRKIA